MLEMQADNIDTGTSTFDPATLVQPYSRHVRLSLGNGTRPCTGTLHR